MMLPFDSATSAFHHIHAPAGLRKDIVSKSRPYRALMRRKAYARDMTRRQSERVRLHARVKASDARLCIVFEGQDTSKKRSIINLLRQNLNPRVARVAARAKPTDREADTLKQCKLSQIDIDGVHKRDADSAAIRETRTHTPRVVVNYAGKIKDVVARPNPEICGEPDIRNA